MRIMVVQLAVCILGSGCSFAFGSAYVGQWRARNRIDYKVCVENAAGRCTERRTISHHEPARRYWGVGIDFPTFGVADTSVNGDARTATRLGLAVEYLRGKGPLAWGVRTGMIGDGASGRVMLSWPITLVGHVGLSDRFSLYGGAGTIPYSTLKLGPADAPSVDASSNLGVRGLVGLETVLARFEEARVVFTVEADSTWIRFGDIAYRSNGLTFNLGESI